MQNDNLFNNVLFFVSLFGLKWSAQSVRIIYNEAVVLRSGIQAPLVREKSLHRSYRNYLSMCVLDPTPKTSKGSEQSGLGDAQNGPEHYIKRDAKWQSV